MRQSTETFPETLKGDTSTNKDVTFSLQRMNSIGRTCLPVSVDSSSPDSRNRTTWRLPSTREVPSIVRHWCCWAAASAVESAPQAKQPPTTADAILCMLLPLKRQRSAQAPRNRLWDIKQS